MSSAESAVPKRRRRNGPPPDVFTGVLHCSYALEMFDEPIHFIFFKPITVNDLQIDIVLYNESIDDHNSCRKYGFLIYEKLIIEINEELCYCCLS